jgi:lipoprotein-releasing system permease protein
MFLGVTILIVVLSVMNGFDKEIKKRTLNVLPHMSVYRESGITDWTTLGEKILEIKGIQSYSPLVEGYVLISSSSLSQGALLQGISPLHETRSSEIDQHMLVGKIKDLKVGEFGVIIGSILANALNVKVGEPVIFSLTKLNITPMGIFPRYKRFYVKGIYKVGSQVDSGLAIINYEDAQRLFLLGKNVNGIKLKLSDPIAANKITPYLKANIDPSYTIKTWATEMTALFNAIKMEKRFVALLLSIIIVIAGFNIVACLILTVSSKRRDIAILRTLGAQASTIATIFMMKGFIIGLLGVISGSIFGCFLAKNIGEIVSWVESIAGLHIFDPNIFFIVKIPSVLVWADILSICFFSIMLSILASIYPAYQASKILPAEVLRHDRRR